MDSSLESMYVNRVWVQCENESCLKWRLLSSEAAATVDHDQPWYCFMNTDLTFNKCSISEEDFPEESQLNENGYKIVYSLLPLGSLVLVKLQNWPSWPGILCPDPFKRKYVTYDLDGNVEQYHIEFLGDPHSRAWINATFVGYYSVSLKIGVNMYCTKSPNPNNMTNFTQFVKDGKAFCFWAGVGMMYGTLSQLVYNPEDCMSRKKWYKSALKEACLLYDYSSEQRLEACCLSKKDRSKPGAKCAVVATKRRQISKTNIVKKKPKFVKRKVVSETEDLLKELEKMLQQAQEPVAAPYESEEEHGEEMGVGEKLSQCNPEVPTGIRFESYNEEDCLIIDGERLKAGECIESITNKFKEIDALMSEF